MSRNLISQLVTENDTLEVVELLPGVLIVTRRGASVGEEVCTVRAASAETHPTAMANAHALAGLPRAVAALRRLTEEIARRPVTLSEQDRGLNAAYVAALSVLDTIRMPMLLVLLAGWLR